MSQSIVYKHYLRALSRFPKDPLRPDTQLQDVIRKRIDAGMGDDKSELAQVNALYSLVENRFQRAYTPPKSMLNPASNPTHYTDLLTELQEAPERSMFGSMVNKWKRFLRVK